MATGTATIVLLRLPVIANRILTAPPIPNRVLIAAAGREVQLTKANVLNPAEMAATGALEEKSSLSQAHMRVA